MAAAVGRIGGGVGGYGSGSGSLERLRNSGKKRRNEKDGFRVSCISSPSVADPYKTLRIHHGATESEVKKAFRQLALKIVMSHLRGEARLPQTEMYKQYDEAGNDEQMGGMYDPDDLWEEWMGWEGAGIRDYTSHINPYI
ncbi:PREDICTED: chaperone protein dnaJ 8, chloroplastic isoform X2 [Ipomoea nil]|uniref:chaperone protein dnaJ 8, chloroplastic isoform X2 n=1 Tax=Ipomoea nil TaxID=35883 RepID=UPI0009015573|nr:PREDICTED: chaperone protein dnaJ 8, chloroplastic isoform X2 [Ipomoea nil]